MPKVKTEEMEVAAEEVRDCTKAYERAIKNRDTKIVEAVEAGFSYREIAKLVKLSHDTVSRIYHASKK